MLDRELTETLSLLASRTVMCRNLNKTGRFWEIDRGVPDLLAEDSVREITSMIQKQRLTFDRKIVFMFGSTWNRDKIRIRSISAVSPWMAAFPSF